MAVFSSGLLPGPETARLDMLISGIVLPEGRGPDEDHRRMKDDHHLGAHLVAGHHYFVTKDYDDIVKKRDWLRAEVGIKVATLPEAVDLARGETRASEPATRPGIEASQAENDRAGLWSHSGSQTNRSGLHVSERPRCFDRRTKREGATQRTGSNW